MDNAIQDKKGLIAIKISSIKGGNYGQNSD